MKKNVPLIVAISLTVSAAICVVGFIVFLFFMGPLSLEDDIKYYGNDENYAVNSGVVESITYSDSILRLEIYGRRFAICESNEKILRANDFYEEVRLDCKITYVTSRDVFVDRINRIVAIEYNGKTYLDFETGKNNLLEDLRR